MAIKVRCIDCINLRRKKNDETYTRVWCREGKVGEKMIQSDKYSDKMRQATDFTGKHECESFCSDM